MTRPDRDTVMKLLDMRGRDVTLAQSELLEDVDGVPLAVVTDTSTGELSCGPENFGWSWDELGERPEGQS